MWHDTICDMFSCGISTNWDITWWCVTSCSIPLYLTSHMWCLTCDVSHSVSLHVICHFISHITCDMSLHANWRTGGRPLHIRQSKYFTGGLKHLVHDNSFYTLGLKFDTFGVKLVTFDLKLGTSEYIWWVSIRKCEKLYLELWMCSTSNKHVH